MEANLRRRTLYRHGAVPGRPGRLHARRAAGQVDHERVQLSKSTPLRLRTREVLTRVARGVGPARAEDRAPRKAHSHRG